MRAGLLPLSINWKDARNPAIRPAMYFTSWIDLRSVLYSDLSLKQFVAGL